MLLVVLSLRHRDERRPCPIERFDDLGEAGKAAGQPIDLVDDDHIDPARLHFRQQALETRTLHISAREAAIVIEVGEQRPAFVTLAQHIGSTSLALGIEAVELLVEALLGRLARVDRAAHPLPGHRGAGLVTPPHRSPPDPYDRC